MLQRLLQRFIGDGHRLDLLPVVAVGPQCDRGRQGHGEGQHQRFGLNVVEARLGVGVEFGLIERLLKDGLDEVFDGLAAQRVLADAAHDDVIGRFAGAEAGQLDLAAQLAGLGLHGLLYAALFDLDGHGQLPPVVFGGLDGQGHRAYLLNKKALPLTQRFGLLMGMEGLEPTRLAAHDSKSCASASSATSPTGHCGIIAQVR